MKCGGLCRRYALNYQPLSAKRSHMLDSMFQSQSQFSQWVVLPLFIFLARVCDVSMDTVRIMLFSKGKRYLAPILGFIQVLIWLLAIRQVFLNLSNVACYIAFAGGFAMGTDRKSV